MDWPEVFVELFVARANVASLRRLQAGVERELARRQQEAYDLADLELALDGEPAAGALVTDLRAALGDADA